MLEAGHRAKGQPAPPRIIFAALVDPDRDPTRPWLLLADGEQRPRVIEAVEPVLVVWSSLWSAQPDARIRFDIAPDGGAGSRLGWTLHVAEPVPDPATLGGMRRRLNVLVNARLRETFGQ